MYPLAIEECFNQELKSLNIKDVNDPRFSLIIDKYSKMSLVPAAQYRPLPQALKFHKSQAKYRWCLGGNRSSKSFSVATEVMWYATGSHLYRNIKTPCAIWYATETQEMIGSVLWASLEPLLQDFDYEPIWSDRGKGIPHSVKIKLPHGQSIIRFKSYDQGRGKFQGTEQRLVAFDEQAPEDIFIESISRIGAKAPFDFIAAMTPIKSQPWLEKKLREPTPDTEIFEYPLDDNRVSKGGFIPDEIIDAMIEQWSEEVRPTRRYGKWGSFLGSIFTMFDRSIHVIDEATEKRLFFPPPHPIPLATLGIDWGGTNPFGVLWATKLDNDDIWYIFDELFWENRTRGGRLLGIHAKEILQRTTEKWQTRLKRTWADHSPTNILEFQRYGIQCMPATKQATPDEISRAGIETIQTLLMPRMHLVSEDFPLGKPRLLIAERCKQLITEIPQYHWTETASDSKDPKDVPQKVNDTLIDALRYIIASENQYAPAGKAMPLSLTPLISRPKMPF